MEILPYSDSLNPTRVDKNVAFNILSFREFESDAKILKAIVLYLAIDHQEKDLFGFYKLDPKVFAKQMYLTESHLFKMHPKPFFIEHDINSNVLLENERNAPKKRMSEHRTWSTCLENALYILTNKSFIDDYRHNEGNNIIVSTKRFNFIDEITFKVVRVGKARKVMYYYKPNKIFLKNLKNYFLNTYLHKYLSLKKPKLDEAYLDFLNRINNGNAKDENSFRLSIDTIANIFQIKKYSQFSAYKIKVTEKFEILKKTIGSDVKNLQLTWVYPNNSIGSAINTIDKTKAKVIYKNVTLITWDRITKKEKKESDDKVFKNIFDTELNRSLIKAYFNTHKGKLNLFGEENKKEAFYRWIFSKEDMDIKEIKFKDTYLDVYKNTTHIDHHLNRFVITLNYIVKIQNEFNPINYFEDKLFMRFKDKTIEFNHLYEIINYLEPNIKFN